MTELVPNGSGGEEQVVIPAWVEALKKDRPTYVVASIYGGQETNPVKEGDHIIVNDADETGCAVKLPVRFQVVRPTDKGTGLKRDQTVDACENMRYASTLNIPTLTKRPYPRRGRALILGGAPSLKDHLPQIKELLKDPANEAFAVNWTHTWLLNQGVVPNHCVFFEIDPEPDTVLLNPHKGITYHICCHCHRKTFDSLAGYKRVLWHTPPNSNIEKDVSEALFPNVDFVGGGITTFTRSITVALFLGFRHFDVFGCDSSFPDDSETIHVKGYETVADIKTESMHIYCKNEETGEIRRFRTTGFLALQAEEFKLFSDCNHSAYSMEVHGDSMLKFIHESAFPLNYGQ